jgi:hypothetical protein
MRILGHAIMERSKETGEHSGFQVQMNRRMYQLSCNHFYTYKHDSILMVCKDITEYEDRLRQEAAIREEQTKTLEMLQDVMDQQQNIIIVSNGKQVFQANKSFYEFLNRPSAPHFSI